MSKDKSKGAQRPVPKPPAPGGRLARPLAPAAPALSRKAEIAILIVILLGAAALRLADRDASPPGLNQDEAANGWNAWCILKTGKDQVGVPWPIFYTRALGSNYTTLNMYLLAPIQAIGGLGVWTTRGAASLGGILTVFLIYFVGKRLIGTAGGLLAAAMLALNPWHLFASRWGSEANICPLLAIAPLALLLAARLVRSGDGIRKAEIRDTTLFPAENRVASLISVRPPSVILAALAGVVTGLCFYGYPAILIFLPLFLIALVSVTWRQWWGCLRGASPSVAGGAASPAPSAADGPAPGTWRGRAAVLAFVIAAAAIFAPLAWQHAFHGEEIRKRAEGTWIWEFAPKSEGVASFGDKAAAVLSRYAGHFGPDFLFLRGDHSSIESPPDIGMFHWYMLPLMLVGLGWGVKSFRTSPGARVILAWVFLYPVGDSLGWSVGDDGKLCLHSLRSSPGLCALVLLAAAGASAAGAWLLKRPAGAAPEGRSRLAFWAAAGGLVLVAAGLNVRYLHGFFGEYNRRPYIYHRYHEDLVEVCRDWLRPRLDQYDAVFVTTDTAATFRRYAPAFGMADSSQFLRQYLPAYSDVYCPPASVNQPYIIMLHELDYDPQRWLDDVKVRDPSAGMFDRYLRCGKLHFLYAGLRPAGQQLQVEAPYAPAIEELKNNGKPDRVLFILRPGEEKTLDGVGDLGDPVFQVVRPDGRTVLVLREKTF
jgi:hypothetical protein